MTVAPNPPAPPRLEIPPAGAPFTRWRWWVVAALAFCGWVLWRVEPGPQLYYPKCFLYLTTGLKCPGCGVLRATHALLNGEFAAAWRLNPLWICYLPLVGWAGLAWIASLFSRRIPHPFKQPWVIGSLVGLAVAYGLARNVPGLEWLG